ncbi:MAG: ATP-dependent DNA ligase [Planctomycetota bacterium]|nr:ATP-dependent DNA ligase [Planctomycetota bacterium]
MRRFSRLVQDLGATRSTRRKTTLLAEYLGSAPEADAGRALSMLLGRRDRRRISTGRLRTWAAAAADLPAWLVAACHDHAGDLAETLAMLVPDSGTIDETLGLDELVRRYVLAPELQSEATARDRVEEAWSRLDRDGRFVYHKILGGAFRIGVARGIVIAALAEISGLDSTVIAHRLAGNPALDADGVRRLLSGVVERDDARPYPLQLASPIEVTLDSPQDAESPAAVERILGPIGDWSLEWKWDGMRGQLVRRGGTTALWSRHDEPIGPSFPEIVAATALLEHDVVLDGEILAVDGEHPLPFHRLQKRIGTRTVEPTLFGGVEMAFLAFDLLEIDGVDVRSEPLARRRERLADLFDRRDPLDAVRLAPRLEPETWSEAARLRSESRARRVEGLVIKRSASTYRGGRIRGDWWKWKVEPYTVDLVVTAATLGHGRRATLHSDYTLAAWSGPPGVPDRRLVTVARAYSGLTDREIATLDASIRRSTTSRRGPVRMVRPEIVMEIAFDGAGRSGRHQSGLALRFPRIARLRLDKTAEEADDLSMIESILPADG